MEKFQIKLSFSFVVGIMFFLTLFSMILFRDTVFDLIIGGSGTVEISESQQAAQQTAELLLSLENITLDTSVLATPYFNSIIPIPDFPLDAQTLSNFGKANPFIGNFSVIQPGTSTVGGVVYSANRPVNNGESVRAVNTR